MNREEIIKGLQEGKTLIMDGWIKEEERLIIDDLLNKKLVISTWFEGDQYSGYRIKWNNLK